MTFVQMIKKAYDDFWKLYIVETVTSIPEREMIMGNLSEDANTRNDGNEALNTQNNSSENTTRVTYISIFYIYKTSHLKDTLETLTMLNNILVTCPLLYLSGSLIINIIQYIYFTYNFNPTMWILLGLTHANSIFEWIINVFIIKLSENKYGKEKDDNTLFPKTVLVCNMQMRDFPLIAVIIGIFLSPIYLVAFSTNDIDQVVSGLSVFLSVLDYLMLALSASALIVYNRALEHVITSYIIEKRGYEDVYKDMLKKLEESSNQSIQIEMTETKTETSNNSGFNRETMNAKTAEAVVKKVLATKLTEINPKAEVIRTMKKAFETISEPNTITLRRMLQYKMIMNLLMSTFFLLYTNLYLGTETNGLTYITQLCVVMLLVNISSSRCIEIHDSLLNEIEGNEEIHSGLKLGKSTMNQHAQYYYTVIVNLATVIFRLVKISY